MITVVYGVDGAGHPQCTGVDMALANTLGPIASKKMNHETETIRTSDRDLGIFPRGRTVYDWRDIGQIGTSEALYLIAHGTEGVLMGDMTAHHLAIALDTVLPDDYDGSVKLVACDTAAKTAARQRLAARGPHKFGVVNGNRTYAQELSSFLAAMGRHLRVVGHDGQSASSGGLIKTIGPSGVMEPGKGKGHRLAYRDGKVVS